MSLAVLPTTGYTGDAYLYAHEVLTSWNQATVNWNTKLQYGEKHLDCALIKQGESEVKSAQADIANLIKNGASVLAAAVPIPGAVVAAKKQSTPVSKIGSGGMTVL